MNISAGMFTYSNSIYADDSKQNAEVQKSEYRNGTVFAGKKISSLHDFIGDKKARANKEAMKRILDVMNQDAKIDEGFASIKEEQEVTKKNMDSARSQLRTLEETKDDMEQAEYEEAKAHYSKIISDGKQEIAAGNKAIAEAKVERLKSHAMVDAKKEGEGIQKATAKETAALYMEDVKSQFDERMEEVKESIEKAQEKAQEEKLQEAKAEAAKTEKANVAEKKADKVGAPNADMQQSMSAVDRVKKFIKTEKILKEDYLGLLMDQKM